MYFYILYMYMNDITIVIIISICSNLLFMILNLKIYLFILCLNRY